MRPTNANTTSAAVNRGLAAIPGAHQVSSKRKASTAAILIGWILAGFIVVAALYKLGLIKD